MSQTIEETETDFLKSVFIYASDSKTWLKEMNLLSFKRLWRLCNVFQIKKVEEMSWIWILRTASASNNNISSPCFRGPPQNVALGSFTSCSRRRSKIQINVMLVQSWCFAHKGWIHLHHTRKAVIFNRRNLRPRPHVSGCIFFLNRRFVCPFYPSVHTWSAFSGAEEAGFTNVPKSGHFRKRRADGRIQRI